MSVEFHPFGISRHSNGTVWQRLSTSRRPFRLVQFGLCAFFNRTILPSGSRAGCGLSYVRKRTSGIRETANSTDWNFTCGKEGRPRRVKGLLGRKNQPVRGEPAGVLSASSHAHMKPHDLLWARLRRIRLWMSVSPINHSAEAHPGSSLSSSHKGIFPH